MHFPNYQAVQACRSMACNQSLCRLGYEYGEALVSSGKDHGMYTNRNIDSIQADVPRKFILKGASKFLKSLRKADEVLVGFIQEICQTECNFTRRIAFSDSGVAKAGSSINEKLLDEMERKYHRAFSKSTYPIVENRNAFEISLANLYAELPMRKLYPLSEPEFQEILTQLKSFTESDIVIPSSSSYGAPILFAAKKSGQGLQMCTDYWSLNTNTTIDQFPLPKIGDLLSRLRGVRLFSKLDLRDGYHQILT